RPNLKIANPSCGNRRLIIENDITAPVDILQIAFAFAQLLHSESLSVHLRWRHLSNARPRIKSDPHYHWNHFADIGCLFRYQQLGESDLISPVCVLPDGARLLPARAV